MTQPSTTNKILDYLSSHAVLSTKQSNLYFHIERANSNAQDRYEHIRDEHQLYQAENKINLPLSVGIKILGGANDLEKKLLGHAWVVGHEPVRDELELELELARIVQTKAWDVRARFTFKDELKGFIFVIFSNFAITDSPKSSSLSSSLSGTSSSWLALDKRYCNGGPLLPPLFEGSNPGPRGPEQAHSVTPDAGV
ncbi:hypothetical protein P167DRAFT_562102 [Morchella conica CCBAS932]|uniref:Uncharacterized protein n=1 Tax=Morchella conica CCBAS932 TaxID=1392247 RepID=A0A3N4L4Y2_9PEZI|nr:hypothetical protein P167DRAFT_562102 [Morchella conica CCBAS932]